jgi:aspartate/methionine/tyrosine aminotransferase
MTAYAEMQTSELQALEQELSREYDKVKAKGLKLNMARGKPSPEQLALSMPMLDVLDSQSVLEAEDGTDCRNYGVLGGIPEAKRLMASILGVSPDNVIVFGNSSLAVMYDTVDRAYTHGVLGSTPWCKLDRVRWLCPVPGYDRHFGLTESFGFELVPVRMDDNGPDMDEVEELVKDPQVKGIWCVPQYSNPSGITYSDDVVRRFAALKPAAPDFRIFWDNAYAVHHLNDDPSEQDHVLEILSECEKAGNPDLVYEFASTSKVTFPGAGIACMAASRSNIDDTLAQLKAHTIGYDKINQLRHARFLRDADGVAEHMKKHAASLRPKFATVLDTLGSALDGTGAGTWTKPRGGYFVSFEAMPGCAKEIVEKCSEAGLTLTAAGATWPHHNDPDDTFIRIAPSYPSNEELAEAMKLFVLVVKLVSVRHVLADRS